MALLSKPELERTEITSFRFSKLTKSKLDELTQLESRASNNNTVIWLIEKEHRKQHRIRSKQDDNRR